MADIFVTSESGVEAIIETPTPAEIIVSGALKGDQGDKGETGAQGPQGVAGAKGDTGAQGPAGPAGLAASVAVGAVTTGTPGTPAAVSNSGTPTSAVLDFVLPAGAPGPAGPPGATGAQGDPGPNVLISPDGTAWAVSVDDDGSLRTTAIIPGNVYGGAYGVGVYA